MTKTRGIGIAVLCLTPLLTSCASGVQVVSKPVPVQIPRHLFETVPHPQRVPLTNGDLARLVLDYADALDGANARLEAIEQWATSLDQRPEE